MQKDSKIFVAGTTGLVGGAIIRQLLDKGFTNIIGSYHAKDPSSIYASHLLPHALRFRKIDLTRQEDTKAFFEEERPEYVFLAAAKVGGILANNTYPAEFIYENLMIATNVIHCSYKYGVKKLLNLGSSCIYPKFAPQPMKEEYLLTGILEPTNEAYAVAKICAIKLCRYYNQQYGTNFISVMPTNLYGPNDNFDLETSHVLPALIRKLHLAKLLQKGDFDSIRDDFMSKGNRKVVIDNWSLIIEEDTKEQELIKVLKHFGVANIPATVILWGTGDPYREFLHVDDLAAAVVFLTENYNYKDIGEFINIGTGEDITIRDLAYTIKRIVGFDGEIVFDPSRPDGTPRKLLDVSKIKALGWEPKISLEEGIKNTYEWYRGLAKSKT